VVVVAIGSSFGDKGHSVAFRIGDSSSEASVWISESSTNVKFARGGLNNYQNILPFVSSVGRQVRADTNVRVSYDFASVSSHNRNLPATGSLMVSFSGINFGSVQPSTSFRIQLTASPSTEWNSDSSVKGMLASGDGSRGILVLSLSMQGMWAASRSVSYDLPTVSSMLFGRIATTGSSNIYVSGHGYSVSQMSQAIRFGHSDVLALNWASDSAIYGKIRQGSGASLTLRISISSQFSIQQINVSYSAPILSSFAGVNGPSSGQFMIDVFGLNFGAIRTSPQAQLGNTGCIFAEWKSDSLARCNDPQGFSRAIGFKLTIDSQSNSQTNVFTFDSPIMNSVSLKNGPTTGNFMIEVFGSKLDLRIQLRKFCSGPADLNKRSPTSANGPRTLRFNPRSGLVSAFPWDSFSVLT
jgi:hypothetical protein